MTLRERLAGSASAAALLWLNAYVCRDWFTHSTAWMNSLHGFQAALARHGGFSLSPDWWPWWDFGMPLEFTSAPLVPAMSAAIAGLRHVSPLIAYQSVSAIFYCAAPAALFLLAWSLTRAPLYSFFAALFYSLLSPAQILVPEGAFSWAGFLTPHRFKLQAVWDETPHCAALTFLLLFLLFLVRAIETRRPAPTALAAISLALAMLAWPFAIVAAALSVLCLITVLDCVVWRSVAIFLWALLLAARFLPLSLWSAIVTASATHEGWNFGVIKYYAALAVVWFTVEHFLKRAKDWRLPFLMLWTLAMSAAPVLHMYFDRPILPQAHRFRIELEAAVALLVVLGLRPLFQRLPRLVNAMVALAALLFALNLTLADRRIAKNVLHPADPTQTMEYRTAQRIARDLPGARVMLPGSIAHWANAFTDVVQFGGGEGTSAYSQTQQRALKEVFDSDAESISVLKVYGVAAIVVPGPASAEFWKPFAHPEKFDSLLPVLWSQEGITVYRVPQRSASLAHVAPEPALADASFQWRDQNHIAVRAFTEPGQAIFVQISYHPGWHATIDGHAAEIHRDELGLMWLRPSQPGPVKVELAYDGGTELRFCGWITLASVLATIWYLARGGLR